MSRPESLPLQPHSEQAAAGRPRFPLTFWMLVALSVFAIAIGCWWLLYDRVTAGKAASPAAVAVPAGSKAPAADFQLTSVDGKPVKLSDLRGKVVLVNFWATWCPPCKAEMPDLQAIYRENADAHNMVILGVDVEESPDAVRQFGKQYGLTFPLLPDSDGHVSNDVYAVRALPMSFIVDREGNVRYTWTGQQTKNMVLNNLAKVW